LKLLGILGLQDALGGTRYLLGASLLFALGVGTVYKDLVIEHNLSLPLNPAVDGDVSLAPLLVK
jgi:hypothetical protein